MASLAFPLHYKWCNYHSGTRRSSVTPSLLASTICGILSINRKRKEAIKKASFYWRKDRFYASAALVSAYCRE
jgi:hypothetical protein